MNNSRVYKHQAIGAVMAWFPANPGSMSGIAIAGYGFGSVIWNPLETEYVNPENISPEEAGDGTEDR